MRFPNCLKQKGRPVLENKRIRLKNYMYARHKPNIDWIYGDPYPDFSRIRTQQSFNWSAFSIPVWTRFNDKKEFLSDYGVVGYCVRTITKTFEIDSKYENESYLLEHIPLEQNYSHCQMFKNKNFSNKQGRKIRLTFGHNAQVCLYPEEKYKQYKIWIDKIIMIYHRTLTFFTGNSQYSKKTK
jgi:hypothetical protein